MAASPKRICWDACAWIALIQKEKIPDLNGKITEDRYALCRSVIDLAVKGKIDIVISGVCLVEVCGKAEIRGTAEDIISAYFENDYILIVSVDKVIGTRARKLMYEKHSGLRPVDATHLATALIANVDELHTFDDKLLKLDQKLTKADGSVLKICKPGHGGAELPLLAALGVKVDGDESEQPTKEIGDPDPSEGSPAGEIQGDGAATGMQSGGSEISGQPKEDGSAEGTPAVQAEQGLKPPGVTPPNPAVIEKTGEAGAAPAPGATPGSSTS